MNNLLPENMELFEAHKSTYDALLAESAALRQEEIRLAEAFSKLPKEVATPEAFELFMRDIHLAHEELNQRLVHLSQDSVERELDAAKQTRCQLLREKDQLSQKMEKIRRELKESEKQRQAAEKTLEEIRRSLRPLYQDVWEGCATPVPTLEILCYHNDRIKEDIDHIEGDLKDMDDDVENLREQYDELAESCARVFEQVNAVKKMMDEDSKGFFSKLFSQDSMQKYSELLNELRQRSLGMLDHATSFSINIEQLQSHVNDAHKKTKSSQEQSQSLRKRMAKDSSLSKALNRLKKI